MDETITTTIQAVMQATTAGVLSVQVEETVRSLSPAPKSHQLPIGQSELQQARPPSPLARKKEWFNRCIRRAVYEDFPDGNQRIEGSLFLKNEVLSPTSIENQTLASSPLSPDGAKMAKSPTSASTSPMGSPPSSPSGKPMDIRSPTSKRFPNWFSFFYPPSPSGSMPTNGEAHPNSDVETEPIARTVTPMQDPRKDALPLKSILKPPKLMLPLFAVSPESGSAIPKPINKYEFLQQERERELQTMEIIQDEVQFAERPRRIAFLETKIVIETHSKEDYNRSAIDYIARSLTPSLATLIKKELNEVKAEMEVHEHSRHLTQFYQVR